MRDSRFFYDVTNEKISVLGQYTVLEFDYKVLFGKIDRHRTMYLFNDAIESIEIRDRIAKKKEIITQ